jgi:hypothetical protein
MTPRHAKRQTVTLACGHSYWSYKTHTPDPGVIIWCVRCKKNTHRPFPMKLDSAGESIEGDWTWHCASNGRCNGGGSHKTGLSAELAVHAARRHGRAHPEHEVWLVDPRGVVVERWGGQDEVLFEIPGEEIPF